MNIFDCFQRIYIINLPERNDRLQETLSELARAGLHLTDQRLHVFPAIRPTEAGLFPSIGARGCFLSHLAVIREAILDQLENVLILEDDIRLNQAALLAQPSLQQTIAQGNWDFAYPGHHIHTPPQTHTAHATWLQFSAPLVCAHFYALNGRILPALYSYLTSCLQRVPGDPYGGPIHVDAAYSMFRQRQTACVTLLSTPSLGGQRSSRSDIYPCRWFDRWPLIRQLTAKWRQLRNQTHQLS